MTTIRYEWQPTTAELAAAAGIPQSDVERFDHNTSPIPTTWAAAVVAGSSSRLNEYPAASYATLREAAARYAGIEPRRVIPGAGADELILLSARAFLTPGAIAVQSEPTYPLYAVATAQAGARLESVASAGPDFEFPARSFAAQSAAADLAWLCVPNNPTGTRAGDRAIREIVATTPGIVVLDAAYAEFSGDRWGEWVSRYDNLLVLHTMSKAFGLAGARVAYGIGHPDLVGALDAVRPPGSIGSLSVELATTALASPTRMKATVADLTRSRADLAQALAGLGFRVLPSPANFLLCEVGPEASALHAALMSEGIIARKFPGSGPLADYLRFTVRTPAAHRRLIDALGRNLP